MSFASGYNAGMNLTAQLRADSRARRQEERQATLDERAEKRAKVQDEINDIKIKDTKNQIARQQKVRIQESLNRAASKVAVARFNETVKKLDPDDVEAYADVYAEHAPQVIDPDVRKTFQNIHAVHAANYKEREGTISYLRKEAKRKDVVKTLDEMDARGLSADPSTPEGMEKINGYKRYDMVNKQIESTGFTWDQTGIQPTGYTLSPEKMAVAEQALQKLNSEREEKKLKTPTERQRIDAATRVKAVETQPLPIRLEASFGGLPMDQNQREGLADAMMGMDLLEDSQRALEELGVPTGKGVGYVASQIMRFAQQDISVADFEAAVTRLIPKLARGTFGEVGVLTDVDIEAYKKTVASLGQTKGANELVMAHTQALISKNLRKTLTLLSSQGYDVSSPTFRAQAEKLKRSPRKVYRSRDAVGRYFKTDLETGAINAGDYVAIYDDKQKKVITQEVQPLETYKPKGN
jgi:hypothetical protein